MKLMLEIDPNHVDAELLTRIGSELECGGTFRQDPLMAVRAYDAAAACPDGGQAANNLGWMFLKGKGVAQDTEKALALFRNAAERGNSIAMVNLGNYYEFAEKQDDKHAVYWYRKAADSGDEKGLFNYANMLHHGRGIRQNRKKAFSIFSNLYARGYHGAAFYMGLYYQNGDAVEQDYQKAREYYRIGALENDMYCICQLGTLYAQGYPKTKAVFGKSKRECTEKLAALKAQLGGIPSDKLRPEMRFADWLDYWYETHCKPNIRTSTQSGYEDRIRLHIKPELGEIPLNRLTQNDLQQFYARLKKSGRKTRTECYGEGLSDRMVRMCHATCRSALQRAVQDGLIRTNPAEDCKLPPKKAREMQVLARDELQRFLIQAQAEGYYELFLLDLATGLRRGELLALQWDDLDFETGVLTISKQVSLVRGKIVMSVPKTKSSIRKLVLPPAVVQVLKEYRESVHSRWMFPSPVLEDLPLNPGSVYDRLQLILEHASCKQVRFHDLRHTFATLALQNGMDVKTLSAMLGHVSAATTLDIYTHSTSDMQHAAARKIDCGIGKAELPDEPAPQANAPAIVDFQPYMGKVRKPGTGCISQINDHLFEGRYSPTWIDGKKHARNVYAHTREECEEKLKVLIAEMKAELAELKRQKGDRH